MDATTPTPASKIQQAFTELTLRLGGIFHEHRSADDEAVWAIARAVDLAYRRCVQSVASPAAATPGPADAKHPAIAHLLGSITATSKAS